MENYDFGICWTFNSTIDENGRLFVRWGIKGVDLDMQDDQRTLKIFLNNTKKALTKDKKRLYLQYEEVRWDK